MPQLFKPRIGLAELSFDVAKTANDNRPIEVELVSTSDAELFKKLLALPAAEWFDPRNNFQQDYPRTLQRWHYELTPGQLLILKPTPFAGQPGLGMVLFANYNTAGPFRLRVDTFSKARIVFSEHSLRVEAPP